MTEFIPFPKIPRLNREIIITEKIDGTNASIYIFSANEIGVEGLDPRSEEAIFQDTYALAFKDGMAIAAGSRTRWLLTGKEDNYGFASWVKENADELFKLGHGHHFGEWWGKGIQRNYGQDERRFNLFNVTRWANAEARPRCCGIVPILYQGPFDTFEIDTVLQQLTYAGSCVATGFMKPEGIIVFHTGANSSFKVTCEKDDQPKGVTNA